MKLFALLALAFCFSLGCMIYNLGKIDGRRETLQQLVVEADELDKLRNNLEVCENSYRGAEEQTQRVLNMCDAYDHPVSK